jgi:hypothetical protein
MTSPTRIPPLTPIKLAPATTKTVPRPISTALPRHHRVAPAAVAVVMADRADRPLVSDRMAARRTAVPTAARPLMAVPALAVPAIVVTPTARPRMVVPAAAAPVTSALLPVAAPAGLLPMAATDQSNTPLQGRRMSTPLFCVEDQA